jgi:hypothetical protein
MSDWRARLREADAGRRFETRRDEIERVRKVVLAAAARPNRDAWIGPGRSLAFVSATAMMTTLGVAASWHAAQQEPGPVPTTAVTQRSDRGSTTTDQEVGRQHLHFSTPGGTRIIWVFDAEFDSKGTLP